MENNKPKQIKGIVKPGQRITKGGRMSPTVPVSHIQVPQKKAETNVPKKKSTN